MNEFHVVITGRLRIVNREDGQPLEMEFDEELSDDLEQLVSEAIENTDIELDDAEDEDPMYTLMVDEVMITPDKPATA